LLKADAIEDLSDKVFPKGDNKEWLQLKQIS
jgi:hypothetical protein